MQSYSSLVKFSKDKRKSSLNASSAETCINNIWKKKFSANTHHAHHFLLPPSHYYISITQNRNCRTVFRNGTRQSSHSETISIRQVGSVVDIHKCTPTDAFTMSQKRGDDSSEMLEKKTGTENGMTLSSQTDRVTYILMTPSRFQKARQLLHFKHRQDCLRRRPAGACRSL